ncbi:MAG: DUF1643 domain-containing protein [Rhodospirillales bacterium]|nr:DUF1643 domain-containing protein [Rhodospirillales bacterium]
MSSALKYLDQGASISGCGRFRYRLWREWGRNFGEGSGTLAFAGLNPSSADADEDDPTVRKLVGFARRLGCMRLEVVNAFARIATHPGNLLTLDPFEDPGQVFGPGERNETTIGVVVDNNPRYLVLGWGVHPLVPRMLNADEHLLWHLFEAGSADAFRLNFNGSPAHPLYLSYDLVPRSIEGLRKELP